MRPAIIHRSPGDDADDAGRAAAGAGAAAGAAAAVGGGSGGPLAAPSCRAFADSLSLKIG